MAKIINNIPELELLDLVGFDEAFVLSSAQGYAAIRETKPSDAPCLLIDGSCKGVDAYCSRIDLGCSVQ